MHLLLIGGTIFLGRSIVFAAIRRGHTVTLFHRGRHGADLFPDLDRVIGDRDGGLDALAGRTFDAVIDTCGYVPRLVDDSARALADAAAHYTFVSSLSVYAVDDLTGPFDESAPLQTLEDETTEQVTGATYGGLKALCEQAAERAMPGRSLVIRPGLIVGPHDPTDRFTYWPVRAARGGRMLAPEPKDNPVEFTDVRDLADWTVTAVERNLVGPYNVSGPTATKTTIGTLIDACLAAAPPEERATPIWIEEATLLENDVAYWSELPLCVPSDGASNGPASHSCERAIAEGLTFRPLEETVRDTLAWGQGRELKAGLDKGRERELLAGPDPESER